MYVRFCKHSLYETRVMMEWPKDMLEEIEEFRLERSIRSLKVNVICFSSLDQRFLNAELNNVLCLSDE